MSNVAVIVEEDEGKGEKKLSKGLVSAKGIKTIEVRAAGGMSVRGRIIAEMKDNRDVYFPDRHFCDEFGISNQQVNQLMRTLERQGSVERVKPQVPDPYEIKPPGQRIMNRWK